MVRDVAKLRRIADQPPVESPGIEQRLGEDEAGVAAERLLIQVAPIPDEREQYLGFRVACEAAADL